MAESLPVDVVRRHVELKRDMGHMRFADGDPAVLVLAEAVYALNSTLKDGFDRVVRELELTNQLLDK